MKKLALTLCLAALTTGAFAQGLVNFGNNSSTLFSVNGTTNLSTGAGSYVFGLFTAPAGSTAMSEFTFSGRYGTNLAAVGRLLGGTAAPVTGWLPGETRAIFIAGWSATLGYSWGSATEVGSVAWQIATGQYANPNAYIGYSAIALNFIAGGGLPSGATQPTSVVFGGTGANAGIQNGINLVPVPEPSSFALAGLGAAALMIFRRRK